MRNRRTAGRIRLSAGAITEAMESRLLMSAYAASDAGELAGTQSPGNVGGPVFDSIGNVFGVTSAGGDNNAGMIYELPAGSSTIRVLASFNGTTQSGPSDLVIDSAGNLYGVTSGTGSPDFGTVFELPVGTGTILTRATFTGNGETPSGRVAIDPAGDIFGSTSGGGANSAGEIFEIPAGQNSATVLHSFTSIAQTTVNGVYLNSGGNLFGTTYQTNGSTEPKVYEYTPATHTYTTLATFSTANGGNPIGTLIGDSAGNLYGTASTGGTNGEGTVYEYSAATRAVITLHSFSETDGASPQGALSIDTAGNLYGTAAAGGLASPNACGTAFEIDPTTDTFSVIGGLGSFDDLNSVSDSLFVDSQGELFGAAAKAGTDVEIFKLYPSTPAQVDIDQQPSSLVAGGTTSFLAAVEDVYGNRIITASDNLTVSLASGPAGAELTGETTASVIYGYAQFTELSLTKAGTYTLTIAGEGLSSDTTQSFTVTPAAATQLAFNGVPATAVAEQAMATVSVDVLDQFGNIADDSSAVTLASSLAGAPISGTTTVSAVNGVATFTNIIPADPGDLTLVADDGAMAHATSSAISVAPAPLPGVTAGARIAPMTMTLGSASASHKKQRVTLAIVSGPAGGRLIGRTVLMTNAATATFSGLAIRTAGQYTLQATAADGTVATRTLLVSPAPAVRMVFTAQPANAAGGSTTTASVRFVDAYGNTASGTEGDITISVVATTRNAGDSLAPTSVPITAGVASIETPSLANAGTYYLVVKFGRRQITSRTFKVA